MTAFFESGAVQRRAVELLPEAAKTRLAKSWQNARDDANLAAAKRVEAQTEYDSALSRQFTIERESYNLMISEILKKLHQREKTDSPEPQVTTGRGRRQFPPNIFGPSLP